MVKPACSHPWSIKRIPIHGSRLVLCRACWEAIDPAPRLAPQPKAEHAPAAASPEVAAPTAPPVGFPEEFGKPIPIRRLDSRIWVGYARVLGGSMIAAALGWGCLELYHNGFITLLVVVGLLAAIIVMIVWDYRDSSLRPPPRRRR
jgi:hypothetical protein